MLIIEVKQLTSIEVKQYSACLFQISHLKKCSHSKIYIKIKSQQDCPGRQNLESNDKLRGLEKYLELFIDPQ
jgi:hypothetical protein